MTQSATFWKSRAKNKEEENCPFATFSLRKPNFGRQLLHCTEESEVTSPQLMTEPKSRSRAGNKEVKKRDNCTSRPPHLSQRFPWELPAGPYDAQCVEGNFRFQAERQAQHCYPALPESQPKISKANIFLSKLSSLPIYSICNPLP